MLAAKYPIELVVLTFIITTLAYFHTLSQIKHSQFFRPFHPASAPSSSSSSSPTTLRLESGKWTPLSLNTESPEEGLHVQTLLFPHTTSGEPIQELASNTKNMNYSHFVTYPRSGSGYSYTATCPRLPTGSESGSTCLTHQTDTGITLTFSGGAEHTAFLQSLSVAEQDNNNGNSDPVPRLGVQRIKGDHESSLDNTYSDTDTMMEDIASMKSGRWMAYALRTWTMRLWDLSMKADSLDIYTVLAGYVLMHLTFLSLPFRARSLFPSTKSNPNPNPHTKKPYLWLTFAILSSSTLSFILALPLAQSLLHIPIDPICLSEALPFFVITVGFDKPLRLARAVFLHPSLLSPSTPSSVIIEDAWARVGGSIWRDYAIEVGVLGVGVWGGVKGVREFCALAALTLVVDGASLRTFYTAVLGIMVEVQRITSPSHAPQPEQPTRGKSNSRERTKQNNINPVPRLKLLLLISFVTLHLLNFLNTLTPKSAHMRFRDSPPTPVGLGLEEEEYAYMRLVDEVEFLKGTCMEGENVTVHPLLEIVHISPPSSSPPPPSPPPTKHTRTRTSLPISLPTSLLPHFPTHAKWEWSLSKVVGDPLLSKWIVVALALSFGLNGVLLRGLGGRAEREKGNGKEKAGWEPSPAPDAPPPVRRKMTIDTQPQPQPQPPKLMHTQLPTPFPSKSATPAPVSTELKRLAAVYSEEGPNALTNDEMILLVEGGIVQGYALEKVFKSAVERGVLGGEAKALERAVEVRRGVVGRAQCKSPRALDGVPFENYNYASVLGACCENVVGYVPIPLGMAGPLNVDGEETYIPMATAEGTLVASTSRGCKALNAGGGVTTVLTQDVMTRGPALSFPSITSAARAKKWIESTEGGRMVKDAFESTSRFAKLEKVKSVMAGRTLYVRFATSTGDAMGMNMISKGVEKALEVMSSVFPEMSVLALSGNYCTDKKPAAINWIEGRGKSVVAEAVVPGNIVTSVLKTSVKELVNLNEKKNLVGSAMAGSIGGFNAHAANILTAVFLATGQDPAQNVESSNCITLMEGVNDGQDLLITVSMPSIEVGTVGGGTVLTPQSSVLKFLGVAGAHPTTPGMNAQQLARIIAAAVMAGELSLMSALAAGHLIRAHMKMNRTPVSSRPGTPGPMSAVESGDKKEGNGNGKWSPTSSASSMSLSRSLLKPLTPVNGHASRHLSASV